MRPFGILTRYSSLAALLAVAATPIMLAALSDWLGVGFFTMLTVLVVLRHHANLSRLMRGEESRIGQRKA